MPLTQVSAGEKKVVCRVAAGGGELRLLHNLGVREGASVQILTSGATHVIIQIQHVGIALNRSLAEQVIV